MQYDTAACQLHAPQLSDSSPEIASPGTPNIPDLERACEYSAWEAVPAGAQEVTSTASRRTGPRAWLRAVGWLIAAGLHRQAGPTTLAIAEDLAARMDYDTGHARYCLDAIAARLGIDASTVKRHVSYLRGLGALAWVQHGDHTNSRQRLGLPGYAATATVYAAVIPAVYDHAMGHRIIGAGYEARIIVDLNKRPKPVDNSPVDNPSSEGLAPPSLTVVKKEGQLEVVGGFKDTSRKRASRQQPESPSPKKTASSSRRHGERRSPTQVARDCWIAGQVRPRINWTQSAGIRQLAHALRPLIDRGLNADQIIIELASWWLDWRPAKPAAYIRARLARQAAEEALEAATATALASPQWQHAMQELRAVTRPAPAPAAAVEEGELLDGTRPTAEQIDAAREAARYDIHQVVDFLAAAGPDACIDLYGVDLTIRADQISRSHTIRIGVHA